MNTVDLLCPVCEEGQLTETTHTCLIAVTYGGEKIEVHGMHYCECGFCGADPVLSHQIKINEALAEDARRRHLNILTGSQIRHIRKNILKLSQKELADAFGDALNMFSKYERGEVRPSKAKDKFLRLLAVKPDLIDFLRGDAGEDFVESHYVREPSVALSHAPLKAFRSKGYNDVELLSISGSYDWRPPHKLAA